MAEQTVILRDARADETDTVFRITVAAYQEYARYMPASAWDEYRSDMLENIRDAGNGDHIVAERAGQIVGSVLLKAPAPRQPQDMGAGKDDVPEIRLLAVPPDARGHGTGRKLTEECIRRARAQGYRSLTLHTHEIMAVAMQMYERMGFVRAPELDYNPGTREWIKGYRLEL